MCSTNVYERLLTTRTVHSRLETSEHPVRSNTFNERCTVAPLADTRPHCHSPTRAARRSITKWPTASCQTTLEAKHQGVATRSGTVLIRRIVRRHAATMSP